MLRVVVSNLVFPFPHKRDLRQRFFVVALFCVCAFATSCKVDGKVTINLREDLTGVVSVAIELDRAATEALGETSELRYEDLKDGGWIVQVDPLEDGLLITADKPFSEPQQLNAVLGEIGGDPLVFHDWEVTSDESFAASEVSIDGHITLTGSIEQFGDDELAEKLDGFRAGIPPLLQPTDEVNLDVELITEGFVWDSVSGLTGSNGRASESFEIGNGAEADVVVNVVSSTQNGRPYVWILGGGFAVTLAGLLLVISRRKD